MSSLADNPEQFQTLRPDGRWEGTARIEGMTCAACAVEIETEAGRLQGFSSFELNPASGLTHWVAETPDSIARLQERARVLGYDIQSDTGTPGEVRKQIQKRKQRLALMRWAVGLLCAMQIMMYAGPEYFYSPVEIGEQSVFLLRWAQWVLVLPVLLFSARPLISSAWSALKQRRWSMDQPVVLGMLLAFSYSSAQLMDLKGHVWFDSIAMLVSLLLLSRWLIERMTQRAVSQVMDMAPDLPAQVLAQTKGDWALQPVSRLVEGQLFRLSRGQAVPLDSRLKEANGWFDESLRTGESAPVKKNRGDLVDAGAKVLSDKAEFEVVDRKGGAFLRQLSSKLASALANRPVRQSEIDKVVPWFGLAVFVAACASGVFWQLTGAPLDQSLSVMVAVFLVTCPCALALSWPLVRLFLMERMRKSGVMVIRPEVLEHLAKVDVIGFDKTGTLTPARAADLVWSECRDLKNTGLTPEEAREIAFVLAQQSKHPMARAVLQSLVGPVNSSQNWACMNAMEIPGLGVSAAVRNVVTGQMCFGRLGSADFCRADSQESTDSEVFVALGMQQGLNLPPEEVVPVLHASVRWGESLVNVEDLERLRRVGASPYLLSGDRRLAVESWATELSFATRLSELTPADKAEFVSQQQAQGHVVMMCGDGLNDAVAFSQADVSVAMQGSAGWSAQQAHLMLTHGKVSQLDELVLLARAANRLGRQNMIWAFAYNAIGIPLAAMGVLTPIVAAAGMGLSSLIVLLNAARLKSMKVGGR